MGVLVGITGPIGSGKSTVAEFLRNQDPDHAVYESGEIIAELAEDFNRALSGELAFETTTSDIELTNQAFIWFVESIAEKLHRDTTWNQLAITKRMTVEQPALFEKLLLYLSRAKQDQTILDTRITRENKEQYRPLLQWLGSYLMARLGSTIWYDELLRRIKLRDETKSLVIVSGLRAPSDADVVRKSGGIILAITRPIATRDQNDPTEAQRDEIQPDITLHNNGSLEALQSTIESLWNDLASGNPAKTYVSE